MTDNHQTQKLKKLSVKITYKTNNGSGIIYSPENDASNCYIFTAKHCLISQNVRGKLIVGEIRIEQLYKNETERESYQLTGLDEVWLHPATEIDIAILKISKEVIVSKVGSIPTLNFLKIPNSKTPCFFKGFPAFTNHINPRTLEGFLDANDGENNQFHIKSIDNFTHQKRDLPVDNIKGMSGSGVIINIDEDLYLCGVVSEYEEQSHRFLCLPSELIRQGYFPDTSSHLLELESLIPDRWFLEQLERSSKNMGPRYSRQNHYPVSLEKQLHAIGSTEEFHNSFTINFEDVNKSYLSFEKWLQSQNEDFLKPYHNKRINKDKYRIPKTVALKTALYSFNESYAKFREVFETLNFNGASDLPLEDCISIVDKISKDGILLVHFLKELNNKINHGTTNNDLSDLTVHIHRVLNKIDSFKDILTKQQLYINQPAFMIKGKAGNGKSQLLAYVANERLNKGYPTVLILGQRLLRSNDLWDQILKELELSCSHIEFLRALNTKGEHSNKRVLIFIDALNEGQGLKLWNQNLIGFIETLKEYPWIKLVVSYRSSFESALFRGLNIQNVPSFEHKGFFGKERQAMRYFFEVYNINLSEEPKVITEFQNPLFLKLFCIAYSGGGMVKDVNSYQGINYIINKFFEHVNEVLALPEKYHYRAERLNLVEKVVNGFIKRIIDNDDKYINYEESFRLAEDLVSIFLNKRGYIDGLLEEEVFYENMVLNDNKEEVVLSFSYEKFEDHLKAAYLLKGRL